MSVSKSFLLAAIVLTPMCLVSCSDDASSDGSSSKNTGAAGTGGSGAGSSTGGNGAGSSTGGNGAGSSTGGNGAGSSTGGNGAGSSTGGGATGGAATGGAANGGNGVGGLGPPQIGYCQGKIYACGDLQDNDGDGLIDAQDPDCLGPCDNTEDSFYGGIPGQAGPSCKVDCYFDQDSGPGNDDCFWDHECDPFSVPPNYYPEPHTDACEYDGSDPVIPPTGKTCSELNAGQSTECHDYCGPLTPNGCDCFGCCELPAGGGQYVWLGSEGANEDTVCTQAELGNPAVCHPCTPVDDCLNTCLECEVCIGKPVLPPQCFNGSGGAGSGGMGSGGMGNQQCPGGEQPCGQQGQAQCPATHYCITGCCQPFPT